MKNVYHFPPGLQMAEIKPSPQLIGIALKGQDSIILEPITYGIPLDVHPERIKIILVPSPKARIQQGYLKGTAQFILCPHPINGPLPDLYINIHARSEEHTSELQSRENLVCRL